MHYDNDYDNDKKQDSNSFIKFALNWRQAF